MGATLMELKFGSRGLACSVGLLILMCIFAGASQKNVSHAAAPSAEFVRALSHAYVNDPTLRAERETLSATDEQVPEAMAGWRPTIQVNANATYTSGTYRSNPQNGRYLYGYGYDIPGFSDGVSISEPLFTGGRTTARMKEAVRKVVSERAHLRSVEEKTLRDAEKAYVALVKNRLLVRIAAENVRVLKDESTLLRKEVSTGVATTKDVAQTEYAFAGAQADLVQIAGSLLAAQADFVRAIGLPAPDVDEFPKPLAIRVRSEGRLRESASSDNPDVKASRMDASSKEAAIAEAESALLPQISAEFSYTHGTNQDYGKSLTDNKIATIELKFPLYQGGSEFAKIAEAKRDLSAARFRVRAQIRSAEDEAVTSWRRAEADRQMISDLQRALAAAVSAFDAGQRQLVLGVNTTYELLQIQRSVIDARKRIVENLADEVDASYELASSIGRLTAFALNLPVSIYDVSAHYDRMSGANLAPW
ncbi:TolC family protein [Gluconacetobacter diazotrophicus]|nr:TolC family protein [Gluconacetobacter diazotrophicus]